MSFIQTITDAVFNAIASLIPEQRKSSMGVYKALDVINERERLEYESIFVTDSAARKARDNQLDALDAQVGQAREIVGKS
jgi:hypothetical protein